MDQMTTVRELPLSTGDGGIASDISNLLPILSHPYQVSNFILIAFSSIIVLILRLFNSILEPMNYELDMTQKEYCKKLAEIDNSLRFVRGQDCELHPNTNHNQQKPQQQQQTPLAFQLEEQRPHLQQQQQRNDAALDCAKEAPDCSAPTIQGKLSTTASNNNEVSSDKDCNGNAVNSSNAHLYGGANHVYPNGWIPVVESVKIKPGTIRKAIIFGRDVIVTRSAEGQASVLGAYCPHAGVHIGIGGRVRRINNQSCVECPFHGWTFRASDGQCVHIPYSKQSSKAANSGIPKQAKLDVWHSTEVDNFIYVWHHINNQPPSWQLEPAAELKSPDWHLAARSCHKTNLELRDMLENGADMNHFEAIHNDLFIFGGQITKIRSLNHLQEYFRHHWRPEWNPVLDEKGKMTHMGEMKLQSYISFFKLRMFDITVHATQIGPARVELRYNSNWYGSGLLVMNTIPKGGRRTKYIQHMYTKRSLFQCFMAKWVFIGEVKMLERDFFIWNHKKNIRNPIFVPEDRCLKQFRRWYTRFYKCQQKIKITADSNNNVNSQLDQNLSSKCKDSFDF